MEEQQQQQPPAEPPPQSAGTPVSSAVIKVNARDADVADRDNSCCVKRKRGRPAKGAPKMTPKPPPLKLKKDEEDVCFICFDGGSLVLCDRRSCPKAYHPACIKRDEAFFRSKAKWNCGWHICSNCEKPSHYMCYTCTYSLCKGCTKDADYVRVRGNKGLCGICMNTIKLIENSAQGNKGEVDFDDKSSWEYLFKVYWMYLKEQLSISFDEVLKATNPWKVVVHVSCKVQTPDELDHGKVDNGSGSENSCIDIDSNSLKNNKCNGFNQRDLSTTCEPTGNICKTKNQINPNEPTIDDSTNAGVVRLGVSSAPADISPLLQPVGDILKDKLWHYQDPTGKVQGPFSMFQLQQWNAYKYFPPDLRIWRVGEKQDNSILLNGALSGKHSLNVSLAHQSEQQSLGASVTMEENKENSQDDLSNSTKSEVCANNQIVEQSREQKVDDTCTQSNGKDESVKSNGSHTQSPCLTIQTDGNNSEGQSENFERREESSKCEIPCHDGPDIDPSPPSAAFSEKLTEGPSDKQREGPGNEGNLEENGNVGSNKLAEGQSNSGQSDQKQSDNEENGNVGSNKLAEGQSNSGQSDQKQSDNEENGNVGSNKLAEGQSNSGQSVQKQSDNEENSGQSSGQNWKGPEPDKTHPPCDASSWLAAIFGEPMADESVSDLLAEVEAMESFGGLESPTSMMKCDEELTDGSITDCLSFPNGLGPMLDVGKGDSLSSTGDLHLPSQPTAADVHPQQKIFGEPSSGASEAHFLKDWLEKQSV